MPMAPLGRLTGSKRNYLPRQKQIRIEAAARQNRRTARDYNDESYFLPTDADEQDRLNRQHEMCLLVLDGRLGHAPVTQPKHVLNVATGTGIWAYEYASAHPDTNVLGTDLYPIQASHSLPNLAFMQHDTSGEWAFPHPFDYIHLRYIVCCFDSKPSVIRKAYDNLTPGGWIEIFDPCIDHLAVDESFEDSAARRWSRAVRDGGLKLGRPLNSNKLYAEWCNEAGFVNVTEDRYALPSNAWPRDGKLKEVGALNSEVLYALVDSLGRFLRAEVGEDEAQALEEGARRDILDGVRFCTDV
ncbi:uncharacterized protein UV8b_08046 [Ustilaginoidea virens]|uniref:Methyltransferase domain-containing protein n=1 Tax=Ustilaginoidea virens TaxID=1159556 RepID=A0A8E5HYN3_USTVR|nr:uncharacterized protein UV8b_08046 [Ustilaginoidea virens]QUC23805.1 hypothetical protein UV8b_08046 [Ustilaginoidea virens]